MPRPADRRTKVELLRAAEAVFVERGLAAAKVEDITVLAGVSKGAFYLHFESKEDCWRQIIEGFLAKLAACVEPPPDELPTRETIAEGLVRWREHDLEVLEFCWQNRGLMRTVLAGGGSAPYVYLIDEFAERIAKQTEAWLRYGVASGIYRREIEPSIVASMISGAYDRVVRNLLELPRRPDVEAWSAQIIGLFTRGFLTPEAQEILDREVTRRGAGDGLAGLAGDVEAASGPRAPLESGPLPVVRHEPAVKASPPSGARAVDGGAYTDVSRPTPGALPRASAPKIQGAEQVQGQGRGKRRTRVQ